MSCLCRAIRQCLSRFLSKSSPTGSTPTRPILVRSLLGQPKDVSETKEDTFPPGPLRSLPIDAEEFELKVPSFDGKTVLVIEDTDSTRKIIVNKLKSIGFKSILQASNSAEALEHFIEAHRIDIITMDFELGYGSLNGVETAKSIRDLGFAGVIIGYTSIPESMIALATELSVKFDGFAKKPNVAELIKMVRTTKPS